MLLEHEAEQLETGEEAAEACEALDFEDGMSGASGSSTGIMASANQGLATVNRGSGVLEDMISSTPKGSPSKVIGRKLLCCLSLNYLLRVFR